MTNQDGIRQLLVKSLNSVIKLKPWPGKLNERRNEFLKSYMLTY